MQNDHTLSRKLRISASSNSFYILNSKWTCWRTCSFFVTRFNLIIELLWKTSSSHQFSFCCSLFQALHNIIMPLSPDDPKTVELQRELNPSLLDRLIRSNFDSSLLLPRVTVDTVRQLKEIVSDTVNSAANFLEGRDKESEALVSRMKQFTHFVKIVKMQNKRSLSFYYS